MKAKGINQSRARTETKTKMMIKIKIKKKKDDKVEYPVYPKYSHDVNC